MNDIIIVTGTPRSGTSLCMQMLEAAGFPLVTTSKKGPDEHNPNGYFEYWDKDGFQEAWEAQAVGKATKVVPFTSLRVVKPNMKIILMDRDPQEVAMSWGKLTGRNGAIGPLAQNFEMRKQRLAGLLADHSHIVISHRNLFVSPTHEVSKIQEYLSLPLAAVELMVGVIDQSLYRNRA